jgi:hypothetical protein
MDLNIMNVVPASECWNMTVNSVIERINNSGSVNLMQTKHFSYLSEQFGSLTYEQITKNFIKEYADTSFNQLMAYNKLEKRKSKLLYDYLACQLLVFRTSDTKFEYITTLIQEIRK